MAEDEKTPSAASAGAATPDASTLGSEKLVAAPELTSAAEWPWMKIPEAAPSAEASAKSEVLEDQPLTFQRNLWDRFDFLWKNRIEPSQGLLQKVCDVLKSRAELERKYGESLLSIGESIGPEAGNSLHGAVEAMIVNFRNRGEQSLVLADELESDIIVSFECVIKQHKEVSKRIHSDVQLLVKHLQDRRKVHDKCARRYGSRCVEAENAAQDCLQAVSMKTQERLKLAQQATMLSKQARVAEYDYYSSIDQANKAQCLYEQQMAHVLEVLQEMEEKRGQCLRDCLRKLAVYETSWLRNMQYDLEGVAKAAEDCDAVRELQNFIETSNKEVSTGPALTRHVAMPFHQLGKGRDPRKMTPELQLHLQVQQQIRQLMDEMSPFIASLLEGSETEEEVEKFCQKLSDSKLRAAFCQVARLAVLKDDPAGTEIDGSAGKNLSPGAFEALTCCFKVALDAADEHNDAWSGRDLMVLAQLYRTEQDGKAVSLLSKVYNHALWNKVTFWEDVLLLSLCEAYAAEAVWRRSLAPGSQFSKPAMTSFLQRFVGYMMAFGISFEQGRNSVASTLRKNSAFLGPQTVQVYSQLLLSAYEVATPEGTMGTDSLNIAMLEGLPSGGIAMQPAATDLGGDDFEAVAFGVQADFSENPGSPGVHTPSAQEASDEEDEKGEETEALRVLEEAQPKVDDVFT